MNGICLVSQIPLRSDPSHRTEMVSQLLFGETYEVIFESKGWFQIRLHQDDYEGWIESQAYSPVNYQDFQLHNQFVDELFGWISNKSKGDRFPVLLGSSLTGMNDRQLIINHELFTFEGLSWSPSDIPEPSRIISTALKYVNAPYLWGGRSPLGIDCSGLTQMVFKINGKNIHRDASQQSTQGENIDFVEEAKIGDLFFFENSEGNIIHVGLSLGDGKIIHASGKVRIDKIDHYGIYNTDIQSYSHKLRLIKRFF